MNSVQRSYHHGNLRNELIRVGLELATEGGVKAVSLREAARRIGVSPSAAYRHFDSQADLLMAVRNALISKIEVDFEDALDNIAELDVLNKLKALGEIYFAFAINNPMQFEIFCDVYPDTSDWLPHSGRPILILIETLEQINPDSEDSRADVLPVWAAMHGIAVLCSTGTLRSLPTEDKWAAQRKTFELTVRGLKLIPDSVETSSVSAEAG